MSIHRTGSLAGIAIRIVGIAVIGALYACGQSGDWVSADETTKEYFDEAKTLQLAPGWRWPTDPGYLDTADDGKKIVYGSGAGRVDAAWYWHCSWARTYFSATDETLRRTAFREVLRLRESAFYRLGLAPDDQAARDRVLKAAEQGDTSMLHLIIDRNCPEKSA